MFGITSPWKSKYDAEKAEKERLEALLQIVENERDQLNEMVTDLHYHLDDKDIVDG